MCADSATRNVLCLGLCLIAEIAFGQSPYEYLRGNYEVREKNKWTLSQWLDRTGEVTHRDFVAAFLSKKDETFAPECNIQYRRYTGTLGASEELDLQTKSHSGQIQLWLTGLFSSSTGIRLLNIDLGVEYYTFETVELRPSSYEQKETNRRTGLNLRLVGESTQDTALAIKGGAYTSFNGFLKEGEDAAEAELIGSYYGGEFQLYLLRWFAVYADYIRYGKSREDHNGWRGSGSTMSYGGFIEIAIFRLGFGIFDKGWEFAGDAGGQQPLKWQEQGDYYLIAVVI